MYKVPPGIQKSIKQELQQTLQLNAENTSEAQELIEGPSGVLYERAHGQIYEQGPDGRLRRVTPDIHQQLLALFEERRAENEARAAAAAAATAVEPGATVAMSAGDRVYAGNAPSRSLSPSSPQPPAPPPHGQHRASASPSPPARTFDPAIMYGPDGKVFERASDGKFYQIGNDDRLYRISYELQNELAERHARLLDEQQRAHEAQRRKRDALKQQQRARRRGGGAASGAASGESIDDESVVSSATTTFDPEFPYHPRRRLPMQPRPVDAAAEATAESVDPTSSAGQPPASPAQLREALIAATEAQRQIAALNETDRDKMSALLHEYDLSASHEAPLRLRRESRPSPPELHEKAASGSNGWCRRRLLLVSSAFFTFS